VKRSRQGGTSFVSSIFIHQLLFGLSLVSYQYYNCQEKIQPSCHSKLACLLIKVLTIVRTCSGAPKEKERATRSMQASKRLTQKEVKPPSSMRRKSKGKCTRRARRCVLRPKAERRREPKDIPFNGHDPMVQSESAQMAETKGIHGIARPNMIEFARFVWSVFHPYPEA